jgi:hypothetical protein
MAENTKNNTGKRAEAKSRARAADRKYEADVLSIQSLRLIAAPNPKDDLTDAELEKLCKAPGQSPEMIHYLIDFVKKL